MDFKRETGAAILEVSEGPNVLVRIEVEGGKVGICLSDDAGDIENWAVARVDGWLLVLRLI